MNYCVLSCCSSLDLPLTKLKEKNIEVIPFRFILDNKEYLDDNFNSLSPEFFYEKISKNANAKTSQINVNEYLLHFEKFVKQGFSILHVCASTGITATFYNALKAKDVLKEKYPTCEIYVINSLCASCGYGLLVDMLANARDKGMSAKELYEYGENLKLQIRTVFCATDLSYYVKGGRISPIEGAIGGALKIFPILEVDGAGKLKTLKKVRGTAKAYDALISYMYENISDKNYNEKCFVCHSNRINEAKNLCKKLENTFPNLLNEIEIFSVGPTNACHTGEGTFAICFVGKQRI